MIHRGSIIEVCHDSIVVITEDCTFERIKKSEGLEEGMEVYFETEDIIRRRNLTVKNISTVAAAIFLLVITSIYGVSFWNTNYRAVALLSVDINPSIEIKINRNHQVIKASALNEDALGLPLSNLRRRPLVDALQELVKMAEYKGYIKETEPNYILVTAVGLKAYKEDTKDLTQLLIEGKEKIENISTERGQHIEVVTMESNKETLKRSKEEHISVGKMEVYKNIQNKGLNGNKIKELKNKTVKELIEEIAKIKASKVDEPKIDKKENSVKESKENNKDQKEKKEDKDNKEKDNKEKVESTPNAQKNNNVKEQNQKEHPVFKEHPRNNKAKDYPKDNKENNKDEDDDEEDEDDDKEDDDKDSDDDDEECNKEKKDDKWIKNNNPANGNKNNKYKNNKDKEDKDKENKDTENKENKDKENKDKENKDKDNNKNNKSKKP
ncbi:anti-sigma factor domain-containing protein [Alkaliphilus sp. MSJ-5]|uniref:Anti-sigma factor domain-containing protein n=1 Tax=Alkaliphilus flagellatus TaxID=2841507 RepID=A0ABS6G1V3_9FIRM|nr:anti-sigma factor domain-containing protein [Alkaliphilus flagellatus]MBU5676463.1 anti-sigma factor domain-containing protein [Alkaliphilus flagellatus]